MAFIHNKTNIGSHGNLKTTNILVSDNFTMKIADYGECVFMSDMKKMYHHSELEYNKRKGGNTGRSCDTGFTIPLTYNLALYIKIRPN